MAEYSTGARAEVRERPKFFHIRHHICYHPDTLNVSISLELIAEDDFERGSFLIPKRNLSVKKKQASFKITTPGATLQ